MASCPKCGDYRIPTASSCNCGYEYQISYDEAEHGITIAQQAPSPDVTNSVTICGWIFAVLGVVLIFFALKFETSVSTEVPDGDGLLSGITRTSQVQNIGLLQQQMMIFQGGLMLAMAGIICIAVGIAIKSFSSVKPPSES